MDRSPCWVYVLDTSIVVTCSLFLLCTEWRSHAGAHWGTCPSNYRSCPTSAALIVALSIANRWLNGLEIEWRSIAMYLHRITSLIGESSLRYGLRTDLAGCKIPKFSGGGCPQTPLNATALSAEVHTNVVCPSIGDVLATPLLLCFDKLSLRLGGGRGVWS